MYVRCGYVAVFAVVLGKQIEIMDRNGGGSIIGGIHFSWWAGGSRLAKLRYSDFAQSRSQIKIEAFGHKEKLYLGLKYLRFPSSIAYGHRWMTGTIFVSNTVHFHTEASTLWLNLYDNFVMVMQEGTILSVGIIFRVSSFDSQLIYVLHRNKASKHNNHDIRWKWEQLLQHQHNNNNNIN